MTELPIRSDLRGQVPYGAPQINVPIKLNTNENPFHLSARVVDDIAESVRSLARDLNRYPDRDAMALRSDLAKFITHESHCDISAENVWPANGSNEVMLQLMQLFGGPGKKVLTFSPTYSMYPDYCRDTFTEYATVNRRDDFSIDTDVVDQALALNPDILILTSPNNPTGTVLDPHIIDYTLSKFSGVIVIDEAYAEFRPVGQASAVTYVHANPRLVVTRTMSKAFSCAGLRLGYAVAHPEVVQAIQLVRLPYHLSEVTQIVARTALKHADELLGHVATLRNERDEMSQWLIANGFHVAPSGGNFILFGTFADRHHIWQQLVNRGILIRETGPSGWLRLSIGTPAENQAFRSALLSCDIN